jgi:hypothetical protein
MAYKKFSDFERFSPPDLSDYIVGYRELAGEYRTTIDDLAEILKKDAATRIPNCLYVNVSGNDSFEGTSEVLAFRTIKRAAAKALEYSRAISPIDEEIEKVLGWGTRSKPVTIFVHAGDYVEDNPIYLPPAVTVIGDNLRSTSIIPKNRFYDVFWVNNRCYVWGFTFRNHLSPSFAIAYPEFAFLNNAVVSGDRGGYGDSRVKSSTARAFTFFNSNSALYAATRSSKSSVQNFTIDAGTPIFDPFRIAFLDRYYLGLNQKFYTNAEILLNRQFWQTTYYNLSTTIKKPFQLTSPYTQGSSSITRSSSPGADDAGGGVYIDGYKVDGPLRSMVMDSFTQFNEGGKGVYITNNGYAQLVSTFTICCSDAISVDNGGSCSINTSNCSFGDRGLVAIGKSPKSTLRGVLKEPVQALSNAFLITELGSPSLTGLQEFPEDNQPYPGQVFEIVDKNYIRLGTGLDYLTARNSGTYFVVQSASKVVPTTENPPFTSYECTVLLETNYTYFDDDSITEFTYTTPVTGLNAGSEVLFYIRSTITASAHTFEYIGTGTTLLEAVPQKGGITDTTKEVVFDDVGRVYFTGTNQFGDFRIGQGLTIVQATGTIEGETFDRSILQKTTPLILALGTALS